MMVKKREQKYIRMIKFIDKDQRVKRRSPISMKPGGKTQPAAQKQHDLSAVDLMPTPS